MRRVSFPNWPGISCLEPLHHYVALVYHFDACRFERSPCGSAVLEQKMGNTLAVNHPHASAFYAHARLAESLAHLRQCARPVVQQD